MNAAAGREWRSLSVILAGFILLGSWFSLAVPPFETPDEVYHYGFARNIAQGYGLPVQGDPDEETPWEHEASQAPLYYLLTGWLTSGIDQSDFDAIRVRNPRANIGDPLFPGNKNFMLYSAAERPLQGANLALHLGRWFSLLLAVVTLSLIFATVRLVTPNARRLAPLVTLLVALIPQFVFISASFSNDNMIIVSSAAVLYWLVRLICRAPSDPIRHWEWLVLGVLLGLAALSKLPGLGLWGLTAVAVLIMAWLRRDMSLPLRAFLPVALSAVAVAGWWYWRNLQLYGSWLGVDALLSVNGYREDPLTWGSARNEFRGLRYSFWGIFGWFNILLPLWVYPILDALTLVALLGVGWGQIRQFQRRGGDLLRDPVLWARWLLALWALMLLGLIAYWATFATSSQGRLLFPAVGVFGLLLLGGIKVWLRYLPRRLDALLSTLLPLLLLGCSLFALLTLFPSAYAQPASLPAPPASARAVDAIYGDEDRLNLVALDYPAERFRPGESVPVQLYAKSDKPVGRDYQLFIQLLDEYGSEVGNLTSHPGWGRNPTTLWAAGALYPDDYPVLVDQPIGNWSPLLADLYIGFINPDKEQSGKLPVTARNVAGDEITPFLGQVVIEPSTAPTLEEYDLTAVDVGFGDVIRIAGVDAPATVAPGATLTTTIMWEAAGIPATDYTAYVHLRNGAGEFVSGFDRAPAGDRFPTRVWQPADRIVGSFPLILPEDATEGDYELWTGLYESESGGALRLPVTDAGGQPSGDGEVMIGAVRIEN